MAIDIARLEKSVSRLDKFLKKAPKNPTPNKIHDVRTSTRKLESALESLTIRNKAAKKRLLRDLPVIRKRCGKVRDMDVLTGHAITVKPENGEQDCLIQLLERLGATRVKHAKRLRQEVKRSADPQRFGARREDSPEARPCSQGRRLSPGNPNDQGDCRDGSRTSYPRPPEPQQSAPLPHQGEAIAIRFTTFPGSAARPFRSCAR